MINNDIFILTTHFVQQCRKVIPSIDSKQFIANEMYRNGIIEELNHLDNADIELVLKAQALKEKFAS